MPARKRGDVAADVVPTDSLVPWDNNPRKNEDSIGPVAESIRRFGFASPIVARVRTQAQTCSPSRSSGMPNTATSAMAGWPSRKASISAG